MALSIKDEATDRMVRHYAKLKGLTYTSAIRVAVTDALRRENALPDEESFVERMRKVQDLVAAHPILDGRSADEIIGYDEHGLPG
ncbi:type II toxin-antitoxin system VapB family antitoxin [Sphingomonas sp. S1-29]|uniref:type II toxin-antitoxin system VapB family antitoxin n=1 Tax=Sphingomonas sp. S1-29 TaxID=2991074 RepID=UPI00223F75A6|nr:type II toxin-antitoxin system VapB family antitoxin [Sphingomonas sp. S1-29]UZK69077.1 type II toxin-antitoxin system VapB family antitoxin [Sphingomonas sp. S1-29]